MASCNNESDLYRYTYTTGGLFRMHAGHKESRFGPSVFKSDNRVFMYTICERVSVWRGLCVSGDTTATRRAGTI
ncbi:hypothetical protein U1Q18_051403, partial [Sarracenia purpurea var. burkii]